VSKNRDLWTEKYALPKPVQHKNKYGNHSCEYEGITFASKRELNRWIDLQVLLKAGLITNLRRQTRFELIPKCGKNQPVHYVADFDYVLIHEGQYNNEYVVEDAKGVKTPVYRIKKKLMAWVHKIEVKEV
jgi:hypothetical protein